MSISPRRLRQSSSPAARERAPTRGVSMPSSVLESWTGRLSCPTTSAILRYASSRDSAKSPGTLGMSPTRLAIRAMTTGESFNCLIYLLRPVYSYHLPLPQPLPLVTLSGLCHHHLSIVDKPFAFSAGYSSVRDSCRLTLLQLQPQEGLRRLPLPPHTMRLVPLRYPS
jgi:hypothetical protein